MDRVNSTVTSLFGGPVGQPEPNQTCIDLLREWLAMAEAGEVVGVAVTGLCADRLARWAIGGQVGGYAMVGAAEVMKSELVQAVRE